MLFNVAIFLNTSSPTHHHQINSSPIYGSTERKKIEPFILTTHDQLIYCMKTVILTAYALATHGARTPASVVLAVQDRLFLVFEDDEFQLPAPSMW